MTDDTLGKPNDNLIMFPGTDEIDFSINEERMIEVGNVINGAIEAELKDVFIIGVDGDDDFYLTSSSNNLGKLLLFLEKAKQVVVSQI